LLRARIVPGLAFCYDRLMCSETLTDLNDRVIELEIRFAHQDRQIEELNGVVITCGQRIAALERENRAFREMLGALNETPEESPDE